MIYRSWNVGRSFFGKKALRPLHSVLPHHGLLPVSLSAHTTNQHIHIPIHTNTYSVTYALRNSNVRPLFCRWQQREGFGPQRLGQISSKFALAGFLVWTKSQCTETCRRSNWCFPYLCVLQQQEQHLPALQLLTRPLLLLLLPPP